MSSGGGRVASDARLKNSSNANFFSPRRRTEGATTPGPRTRSTDAGDMPGGADGAAAGSGGDPGTAPWTAPWTEPCGAATPATLATPRSARSAGVGPGLATGAWPLELGWYMRYSRAWSRKAARSAGSRRNGMSSGWAAHCFSGTASASTARRRMRSRCCCVREATPRRMGKICAARSSGVARAWACSTYTRAKLRTMGGRSGLT